MDPRSRGKRVGGNPPKGQQQDAADRFGRSQVPPAEAAVPRSSSNFGAASQRSATTTMTTTKTSSSAANSLFTASSTSELPHSTSSDGGRPSSSSRSRSEAWDYRLSLADADVWPSGFSLFMLPTTLRSRLRTLAFPASLPSHLQIAADCYGLLPVPLCGPLTHLTPCSMMPMIVRVPPLIPLMYGLGQNRTVLKRTKEYQVRLLSRGNPVPRCHCRLSFFVYSPASAHPLHALFQSSPYHDRMKDGSFWSQMIPFGFSADSGDNVGAMPNREGRAAASSAH